MPLHSMSYYGFMLNRPLFIPILVGIILVKWLGIVGCIATRIFNEGDSQSHGQVSNDHQQPRVNHLNLSSTPLAFGPNRFKLSSHQCTRIDEIFTQSKLTWAIFEDSCDARFIKISRLFDGSLLIYISMSDWTLDSTGWTVLFSEYRI